MKKTFMGRLLTVCMLIGIGVAIAGFASDSMLDRFFETAVETSATISRIEESKIIPERFSVYVTHEVDGEDYEGVLGYYDESMQIGDSVVVHYNPELPASIRSGKEYSSAYQMLTWGLAIAIAAVILNIIRAASRKKREEKKIEKKIIKRQEQKSRKYEDYDEDD